MDNKTTEPVKQPKRVPNPTGKGGFGDHPEHANPGGRPKNAESFTYWYRVFKNMTITEMEEWNKNTPKEARTVAADLAYRRIFNSQKDLKEFQEVADRSEGKARQSMDLTTGGEKLNIALVEFNGGGDN